MPCVLAVLRRERGALPFSKREWLEAIMLAEQERVAPAFALAARQTGLTLPEAIDTALQKTERAATLETFLWVAELRGLLAAFATAHIAVLPLKGPFFAQRVYGGSALRPCRDLDLLVRAADLRRAEALLHELGFQPAIHADDYHQSWTRRTTNVELHFDVEHPLAFNFDITAVWRRAVLTEFEGVPAWRMEPVDELIFLGLHGVRHRFDRLGLVLDLHRHA